MTADPVLLPLVEEQSAVDTLTMYRTEAELADALVRVRTAVERVLRLLLRSDEAAPDDVRLTALSPELLPAAELIADLRRRERISIDLAGLVHSLDEAAVRAQAGTVRAADADVAITAVRRLTDELATHDAVPALAAVGATGAEQGAVSQEDGPAPARGLRWRWIAAAAPVVVAAAALLFWPRSRLERGVEAFREGRWAEAERIFAERVTKGDDATSLLYLGRMYRADGRYDEAADALRRAAAVAPDDADIRRELGYLFLDLDRLEPAVEQFRRAQEQGPAEPLNWIGLIRALRALQSPEADEWLARAPAGVREMLGAGATGS